MPAVITFTLSTNDAGTQVKYSSANVGTPAEQFVNADAAGLVTLNLGNAVQISYLVTLPDGQFAYIPITPDVTTVSVGTIPIYPDGVSPNLRDITSLFVNAIAGGGGSDIPYTPATGVSPATLDFAEEGDNGSSKVVLAAPASLAGDIAVELPSTAGVLATTALAISLPRSYLATTVTYNDTAALANTALSVTLEASGVYAIALTIHSTSVAKALNLDFGGTVGVTNFIGEWVAMLATVAFAEARTQADRVTAIGTDFSLTADFDGISSVVTFQGSIEVSTAGTFILRGAQNVADASNTTILRGSTLIATKMS